MVLINAADESSSSMEDAEAAPKGPSRGMRFTKSLNSLLRRRGSTEQKRSSESVKSCPARSRVRDDRSYFSSGVTVSSVLSRVSLFRRRSSVSFKPAVVVVPVPTTSCTHSKRVSFSENEPTTIVTDVPQALSKEEKGVVFYTKKDLNQMSRKAQCTADVAWKKDRQILACILHCYGFVTLEDLTEEKAVDYIFGYEVEEEQVYESISEEEGSESKCEDVDSDDIEAPTTTLRGLERQITCRIVEHRMNIVQSVLDLQNTLRDAGVAPSRIEKDLAKLSSHLTRQSRRFARLLGKADEAISATNPTQDLVEEHKH